MGTPMTLVNGFSNTKKTATTGFMPVLNPRKVQMYFNDFTEDIPSDWTETATSAGAGTSAGAVADAGGGILRITTAANENDGLFIESPGESWLVESGKKMWMETRVALGDAIQSDFIFGLHSTDTTPQDATLRFLFESVDGSAACYFNVDDDTTDSDSSTVSTFADDTFVTLGMYFDGTNVHLFENDVKITQMSAPDLPGAEMAIGLGYLNGAAGAETTDIDWILVAKER